MPYNGEHNETNEREVNANFFKTLKAPLMRGREFTENDDATHPNVVIVNEAFVRKFLPGQRNWKRKAPPYYRVAIEAAN